jgi:hypothetical protein
MPGLHGLNQKVTSGWFGALFALPMKLWFVVWQPWQNLPHRQACAICVTVATCCSVGSFQPPPNNKMDRKKPLTVRYN